MKKIVIVISAISFLTTIAVAQVRMPAPSPTQTIKQDFGLGTIEVVYSRPGAKGRKIFGDLVPFNKLWRTGANAATSIHFSEPVELNGKKIDTGTYVLYSIPNLDNWDIILNTGVKNWGTENYKENDDICRFKVEPVKMKNKLETFTMQFANVKPESCELQLMWDKTLVSIPIVANVKDKIKAQIDAAMLTEKKPYWQAAQYYNEYEHNLNKALDNCSKAFEDNNKAYWILLYKAKIQKEMGDNAGAMASSKKSLELATEAKNDDYVKMNEELQRKLK
jgi:hypothetical protein